MKNRTVVMASLLGAFIMLIASVSTSRSLAGGPEPAPAMTYHYFPATAGRPAELVDTRTGAVYERKHSTDTEKWALSTRPVGQAY